MLNQYRGSLLGVRAHPPVACIIKSGCGGIDGCCNVMHVFYGACEVIVGGDDGEDAVGYGDLI